jgi:hypothetical protein
MNEMISLFPGTLGARLEDRKLGLVALNLFNACLIEMRQGNSKDLAPGQHQPFVKAPVLNPLDRLQLTAGRGKPDARDLMIFRLGRILNSHHGVSPSEPIGRVGFQPTSNGYRLVCDLSF